MKIIKTVLIICSLFIVFNGSLIFAQTQKKSKDKSVSNRAVIKNQTKKVSPGDEFPENEIESPFRYVIINDDVQFGHRGKEKEEVPVRRFVEVLMEKRAFNEANLIYLFNYLANFYAEPVFLHIEVHTSLMTLETLEERVAMSNHSSRDNFRQFYKTASYSRFDNGEAGFIYDTGKSGKFISKSGDLTKTIK